MKSFDDRYLRLKRIAIELLAILVGAAGPLASYAIRVTWPCLMGSTQVAIALLIASPALATLVVKVQLSAVRTARFLFGGIVVGAVASYEWWWMTTGDRTWRISIYVLTYEAAFLSAIALLSFTVSFLLLRRTRLGHSNTKAE